MLQLRWDLKTSRRYHDSKSELQKSNSTQKRCAVNTEGFSRSGKRRKSRIFFHLLDSSTDTQAPLITPQKSNPSPSCLYGVLCKLMVGGKNVRLTINPKKINHILSCQPSLLSSQNKHHDKNASSIHEIYTYVYMKRNICVYRSNKVTL